MEEKRMKRGLRDGKQWGQLWKIKLHQKRNICCGEFVRIVYRHETIFFNAKRNVLYVHMFRRRSDIY
jgi:hypothetical protein